ncbi:TPA: cellulose biosynthesis protein BcsE [Providencia rettgeri]|nr:cellulose biosynthesis protein BcsE [Providencia rettgeri]
MNNAAIYTLGIQYLDNNAQNMISKGIYWLNINKPDTKNFLNQMTLANEANNVDIYIDDGMNSYHHHEHIESPLLENTSFMFNKKKNKFNSKRKELIKQIKLHKNSLVVFHIPDDYLTHSLVNLLKNIKLACIKYNCAALFLSYSSHTGMLMNLLLNKFKLLSGFSLLSNTQINYSYDILYWISEHSIIANEQVTLVNQNNKLTLDKKTENIVNLNNDSHIYYVHDKIMNNRILNSDYWILVKTNKELIEIAEQSYSATLVLSITEIDEIDGLAEKLHHIRSIRGKYLKLVLVELKPCIRASDERLLLTCGANLVIHHNTSMTNLLSLLESIQNQMYSKALINDVSPLIEGMKPLRIKGFISPEEFKHSITALLENEFLPKDTRGLLFSFHAVDGLHPKQALSLCRIRRYGDIVTIDNDIIYLFLSSCRLIDEKKALGNIFQLPIENIFQTKALFNRDKDIKQQLMSFSDEGSSYKLLQNTGFEIKSESKKVIKRAQSFVPKPVTINFS